MSHKIGLLILILLLPLPVLAQQPDFPDGTLQHDGLERTYRLFLPPTYDDGVPLPLVVALHPAGTGARGMAQITRLDELALEENFIVLYPEGPGGYWDYGAGFEEWDAVPDVRDDPGYIEALVNYLDEKLDIDTSRIYAVGFSNGARMAYRLGCEYPDLFAAIGMVAATISDEITTHCADNAHPAVIFMHGTADDIIPWEGKPLYIDSILISHALSAPETAAFWIEKNGCTSEPETPAPIDIRANRLVKPELYTNCEHGGDVAFYTVENGGHSWFTYPAFNATEVIWEFFASKTLDN